jgi:hypothetical protein
MQWYRVVRELIEIVPGRHDGGRQVGYATPLAVPASGVRLKPTRRHAAMVSVALVPWVVVAFLTLAVCVQRISLANNVLQFNLDDDLNALRANDGDLETAIMLQAIAILFAAIFFVRWQDRVRANSDALGLYRSRWGQTWLVLAWLIPILNFWAPMRIVSDLWRGSDPALPRDKWPRPGLVMAWWAAWLYYNLGGPWSEPKATSVEAAGHIRTMAYFEIAEISAGMIAAVLAAVVVWRISLLQHSYRVGRLTMTIRGT